MLIALLWIAGIWLVGKARSDLPWHEKGDAPGGQEKPRGHAEKQKDQTAQQNNHGTARTAFVFGAAALVTLAAGVALEKSGDQISSRIGMSGVLFGSTVLAAATSLPELSNGLRSVKMGDYQLAVSDIFGGNAFLPVLFLLAALISGQAVLPQAQSTDIYLAGLGVLLTAVYIYGLLFRPHKRKFSEWALIRSSCCFIYALGIIGLFAVAGSQGGK